MHRSGWDLSRTIQQQHQQGLNRELALITWSWTCQVASSVVDVQQPEVSLFQRGTSLFELSGLKS